MVHYPRAYFIPDIQRECGKPLKSKPGEVCKCPVTYFENGEWTCGRHRSVPEIIELPWAQFEPQECSICMEMCQNIKTSLLTPCNHVFHKKCITKWAKNKPECPLCRRYLLQDVEMVLIEEEIIEEHNSNEADQVSYIPTLQYARDFLWQFSGHSRIVENLVNTGFVTYFHIID